MAAADVPTVGNESRAQAVLGESSALIDQLYLQLVKNIKPPPDSFFSLLFPCRPLNLLEFIDARPELTSLSDLEAQIRQAGAHYILKKQRIADAEFNLADQVYPAHYAVSGSTGESLSALYIRLINNVVPKIDHTLLRDQLAIINRFTHQPPGSSSGSSGPSKPRVTPVRKDSSGQQGQQDDGREEEKTPRGFHARGASVLIEQPQDDVATKYIRLSAHAARTQAETLLSTSDGQVGEQDAEDGSSASTVRDVQNNFVKLSTYSVEKDITYWRLQLDGNAHEVQSLLSFVDVTSPGELLLRARSMVRQLSVSGINGSRILPVRITPSDWAYKCYGQEALNRQAADARDAAQRKQRWETERALLLKQSDGTHRRALRSLKHCLSCLRYPEAAVTLPLESLDWLQETADWYVRAGIRQQQAIIGDIQRHYQCLGRPAEDIGDELLAFLSSRILQLNQARQHYLAQRGAVAGWQQRMQDKRRKRKEAASRERQAKNLLRRQRSTNAIERKDAAEESKEGRDASLEAKAEEQQQQPEVEPDSGERDNEPEADELKDAPAPGDSTARTDWSCWFDDAGEDGAIQDFVTCCKAQPSYERFREVLLLKTVYQQKEKDDNDCKWAVVRARKTDIFVAAAAAGDLQRREEVRSRFEARLEALCSVCDLFLRDQVRHCLTRTRQLWVQHDSWPSLDSVAHEWRTRESRNIARRGLDGLPETAVRACVEACDHYNQFLTLQRQLEEWYRYGYNPAAVDGKSQQALLGELCAERVANSQGAMTTEVYTVELRRRLVRLGLQQRERRREGLQGLSSSIQRLHLRQERELNVSASIQVSFQSMWLDIERDWLLQDVLASSRHFQSVHDRPDDAAASRHIGFSAGPFDVLNPVPREKQGYLPCYVTRVLVAMDVTLQMQSAARTFASQDAEFEAMETAAEALGLLDASWRAQPGSAKHETVVVHSQQSGSLSSRERQSQRERCQLRIPGAQLIGMISKFTPKDQSSPYYTPMEQQTLATPGATPSVSIVTTAVHSPGTSGVSSTVPSTPGSRGVSPILQPLVSPRRPMPKFDWKPHLALSVLQLRRRVWLSSVREHGGDDFEQRWVKVTDSNELCFLAERSSEHSISQLPLLQVTAVISTEQHMHNIASSRRELAICIDEGRALTIVPGSDADAFVLVFDSCDTRNALQSALCYHLRSLHPHDWKLSTSWLPANDSSPQLRKRSIISFLQVPPSPGTPNTSSRSRSRNSAAQ